MVDGPCVRATLVAASVAQLALAWLSGCGDTAAGDATPIAASAPAPASASGFAAAASALASASAAPSAGRALARGRQLATEGRWQEAMAAFEQATAGESPDPYALGELSWAALHAGDLERSLAASELGLSLTEERKARAMLLYNRGRAQEQRGLEPEARQSYELSLELRPHDAVKKRLEGLGGTAPPAPERRAVCDRAFNTVREACACFIGARQELGLPQGEPSCASLPVDSQLQGRPLEVVRIAAGSQAVVWLLADVKGRLRPVVEVAGGDVTVKKLLAPLDGDPSVVSLLFERTSTETGKAVRTTAEVLCLVGDRGGAPACPLEVPHAVAELKNGLPSSDRTVTLARSIRSSGKVEVKKQGGPEDLIPAGSLGSHALW